MRKLAASLGVPPALLIAPPSGPGICFDVIVSENGEAIATQSAWAPFGHEAVLEIPGRVRVVAAAAAPNRGIHGDISKVQARMYYLSGNSWVLDWDASMDAYIEHTPSFQRTMADQKHRVVINPRKAERPSSC